MPSAPRALGQTTHEARGKSPEPKKGDELRRSEPRLRRRARLRAKALEGEVRSGEQTQSRPPRISARPSQDGAASCAGQTTGWTPHTSYRDRSAGAATRLAACLVPPAPPGVRPRRPRPFALPRARLALAAGARDRARGADRRATPDQRTASSTRRARRRDRWLLRPPGPAVTLSRSTESRGALPARR